MYNNQARESKILYFQKAAFLLFVNVATHFFDEHEYF